MQCIAQLIALNADQRPAIALRAFHLLAQIDDRHPDMLWNRLVDGIRSSYSLQRSAFHTAVAVKLEDKEVPSVCLLLLLLLLLFLSMMQIIPGLFHLPFSLLLFAFADPPVFVAA